MAPKDDPGQPRAMKGNVNTVFRIDGRVHRPASRWSAGVQALLQHLQRQGFDGAPRALGFDKEGREVVSYIEGTVRDYPLPEWMWDDRVVDEAARMLRRYHEAAAGFVPPPDAEWQLPASPDDHVELICHNDFAPYNAVFRDRRLVGMIDFDAAGPGSRLWDLAYAVYRFVPLSITEGPPGLHRSAEQARRLRLFCDAYDDALDARPVVEKVVARLRALERALSDGAARGDPAAVRHVADGDLAVYVRDREHVEASAGALIDALDPTKPPGEGG